jgi:glutaredoxin-like protein DUF836
VTGGPSLVLLGQPGCHLCHEMRAVVLRVAPGFGWALEERDWRDRPEWAGYGLDIPVLLAGTTEVARHRVDDTELARRLSALTP